MLEWTHQLMFPFLCLENKGISLKMFLVNWVKQFFVENLFAINPQSNAYIQMKGKMSSYSNAWIIAMKKVAYILPYVTCPKITVVHLGTPLEALYWLTFLWNDREFNSLLFCLFIRFFWDKSLCCWAHTKLYCTTHDYRMRLGRKLKRNLRIYTCNFQCLKYHTRKNWLL